MNEKRKYIGSYSLGSLPWETNGKCVKRKKSFKERLQRAKLNMKYWLLFQQYY